MDREDVLNRYVWTSGSCFRCARLGVLVTDLDLIQTPAGATYVIRACQECVLALEDERQRAARRAQRTYEPGGLGRRRKP